ncbi:MAG: TIGR03084 family metal-binding protein [Acidimicrobiales bacterium]
MPEGTAATARPRMPRPTMPALLTDLMAETAYLRDVLLGAGPEALEQPTPAAGWAVRDQVSHLAFFDEVATVALASPAEFTSRREAAQADLQAFIDSGNERGRKMAAAELLEWFGAARAALAEAAAAAGDRARVPWYGADMGALSFVTARLMETWAHGQDVADTVGAVPSVSDRLRHVADLGARARVASFLVHGLAVPDAAVRVELASPGGELWSWGPPGAPDAVAGPALDFCLVVTRRRHVLATSLSVTGDAAARWMEIAQAYAGPPGPGRAPEQFRGSTSP